MQARAVTVRSSTQTASALTMAQSSTDMEVRIIPSMLDHSCVILRPFILRRHIITSPCNQIASAVTDMNAFAVAEDAKVTTAANEYSDTKVHHFCF